MAKSVLGCVTGLALLLACTNVSSQSTAPGATEPVADGLAVIVEQQRGLRGDLDAGAIAGLTPRQVQQVRKAQAEVFALAEGKATLDALSIDEKVRLENALERINAIVVDARGGGGEANRNVCWRERTTGTAMMTTRCGTVAEKEQAREGARGFLERPRVCVPPGCGN